MQFPTFPDFRRVALSDQAFYEAFYEQCDPYSDFSFTNLLIWLDINNDLAISQYGNNIILRFSNVFDKNRKSYTILGNHQSQLTIQTVLDFLEQQGQPPELSMVPEGTIKGMPASFSITTDPASSDYVLNVKKSLAMQGGDYADFRQKLHAFQRKYAGRIIIRVLTMTDPSTKKLIKSSLKKWGGHESFSRNDPRRIELRAIDRYFTIANNVRTECLGVFIDDSLVSFGIYHFPPQKKWVIYNHLKVDYTYKDLFDYTYYVSMQHLSEYGIEWVNFEQDLGIQGLRSHKERLRPSRRLYRYTISR